MITKLFNSYISNLEKCPKVTFRLEKFFSILIMMISEKFHFDLESLIPQIARGQEVTSTVTNPIYNER